jgi:ATP-dependent RNA helicase RhlE
MLDMGFLPDVRRVLKHLPARRQTLFFSATMPPPITVLAREILHDPVPVNVERPAAPAVGITQAVYPVSGNLKTPLLAELLRRGDLQNVLVFTRTKHRANRLFESLSRKGVSCERIHGNRSQPQRTQALAGFKAGRYRVLVATDIAARGIDVEALPHVVNFDVPHVPDDYIHRVGRTARAERTGDAYTFVSPEEESDLRAIEKTLGRRLPRITVPGFDYSAAPIERLEIPLAERIASIRARKAADRERAKMKGERRVAAAAPAPPRRGGPVASRPPGPSGPAGAPPSWSSRRNRRAGGRPPVRTRTGRP